MKDITMRDAFLDELYKIASTDRRVVLVSADFGAPSLDRFRKGLSGQFINVGIAEQNMVSVAAGLALGGKIVFTYAILPFITMRCYGQTRVDLCSMNLPVTLVGVGPGYAYDDSGPTHHAPEDIAIMRVLPNIAIWSASDSEMAVSFARMAYDTSGPKYIRLDRTKHPVGTDKRDLSQGFRELRRGEKLTIIATGYMVGRALKVADELAKHDIDAGVIDLYRIKPINQEVILGRKRIVTLEEHFLPGGLGSIVSEIIVDSGQHSVLKRIGLPLEYTVHYGGREHLHELAGLDVKSVTKTILDWEGKWGNQIYY